MSERLCKHGIPDDLCSACPPLEVVVEGVARTVYTAAAEWHRTFEPLPQEGDWQEDPIDREREFFLDVARRLVAAIESLRA